MWPSPYLKNAIDSLISLFDSPSLLDIPIIMLAEPNELFESLREHYFTIQQNTDQPPDINFISMSSHAPSSSTLYLLEQIVAQGSDQLACQQNVNILSDLFPTLRALSAASRTVEERRLIVEYLGDQLAKHIVSFWNEESICG